MTSKYKRIRYVYIAMAVIILLFSSKTEIRAAGEQYVTLGGMPFGVCIPTDELIIGGFDDVETDKGPCSPAREAGLLENDIILSINNKKAESAIDVTHAVRSCNGEEISFKIKRRGEEMTVNVKPVFSKARGHMCIGLWLEDSTAGLGTVTYIEKETGSFAGLGHGITDKDGSELSKVSKGAVYEVRINDVNKGKKGTPGELCGDFLPSRLGVITKNTEAGVFGVLTSLPSDARERSVPLGKGNEAKNGGAVIYCTVGEGVAEEYAVELTVLDNSSAEGKNFLLTVKDEELIEKTGGIVRGMSGSPIIQDGKLVGAVTHVLVNDPTRGYGIFIENMLDAAP